MLYVTVVNSEGEIISVKSDELLQVGDTLILDGGLVYRVKERGLIASSKPRSKGAAKFLIVEEIEGSMIAPSGRYEFAARFR